MSENATTKKTSQQDILNYISVNFQKMDSNKQNGKSSAKGETSANKTPKEQRPKGAASSMTNNSTNRGNSGASQSRRVPTSAAKAGNAPNTSLNPKPKSTPTNSLENQSNKARTPPSIEAKTHPQKKLMMENQSDSARPFDTTSGNAETTSVSDTEDNSTASTIRCNTDNTMTRRNQQSMYMTRQNKQGAIPRCNNHDLTPRCNMEAENMDADDKLIVLNTTRDNTENAENTNQQHSGPLRIMVENSMDVDGEEITKTLDDLGPELAKMWRILANEITKSLSRALIPLQNDITQLRADTAHLTQSENMMEELKLKNANLHARVSKLELNNLQLKKKIGNLEDHLLDNNVLFSGIREEDGETEMDRYQTILNIISTTFIGPDYQMQLNQAKQVCIE